MCTRILNNIDRSNVTVGRCMDWEFSLPAYVYIQPAGRESCGISEAVALSKGITEENVLTWTARYASASTQIGDNDLFGTDDGINEAGLVVNVLYDSESTYGNLPGTEPFKALSVLRWGQFILDSFASVEEAVAYFKATPIYLVNESVPGDEECDAELHVAISDQFGNSVIIEMREGVMIFYQNANYTVVTNQPGYDAQLVMSQYWFYQWGISPIENKNPVYTAPGGDTPVQRFQRACFYRYMHRSEKSETDRLMQVKSMINTCAVPILFQADNHPNEEGDGANESSYTLWLNLADSQRLRYYFLFTDRIGALEFDVLNIQETKRIKVSGEGTTSISHGVVNEDMEPCEALFSA